MYGSGSTWQMNPIPGYVIEKNGNAFFQSSSPSIEYHHYHIPCLLPLRPILYLLCFFHRMSVPLVILRVIRARVMHMTHMKLRMAL